MVSPLILMGLWEICARMGILNPAFVPAPTAIARAGVQLVLTGELLNHAAISLAHAFIGFAIGSALAIPAGFLVGLLKCGEIVLEPPIELLRSIPPISMISAALLWFGIGASLSVFIIAWACFFPLYINTVAGAKRIEVRFIQAARSLGARTPHLLYKVILPQSMPMIFAGFRTSLATSLMGAVISEMFGAQSGLGFLIMNSERYFLADKMFAGIVCIGLLGFLLNQMLLCIERKSIKWSRPVTLAIDRNGAL